MTSIRRLIPGLSSLLTRATSLEVSAPVRQQETMPVEPVRAGFSDQSDFLASVDDVDSPLTAHTPLLAGRAGEPTPEPLRSYTGESDFQAQAPRYGHLLGTAIPSPGASSYLPQAPTGLSAASLLAEHMAHSAREHAHPFAEPVDSFEPSVVLADDAGFIADLSDLPEPPAPEDLLALLDVSGGKEPDFLVDAADVVEPPRAEVAASATPSAERIQELSAGEALELARDVAGSGSPEQQAQVATALYARGQQPDVTDAPAFHRAAALAAASSPEATQALLAQVGDASDFVRTLLREG